MDEIERSRLQLAVEQIVDDEFHVGDTFCLQKCTSRIEQALVDVRANDLPGGPDPLAQNPKPAQGSRSDVQRTSARAVVDPREELPPAGLPHERLQPQTLQLRGLVG